VARHFHGVGVEGAEPVTSQLQCRS